MLGRYLSFLGIKDYGGGEVVKFRMYFEDRVGRFDNE